MSLDRKLDVATKWRDHLKWQYIDRPVYWSLRWASRAQEDVLVVIIDALDRSKFALPRYKFPRKSEELDRLFRPKVTLTGAIAHGWCRRIFITDEELHKGGSAFLEVLCLIIQDVYEVS